MAKPLPATDSLRSGVAGSYLRSPIHGAVQEVERPAGEAVDYSDDSQPGADDVDLLRAENEQIGTQRPQE